MAAFNPVIRSSLAAAIGLVIFPAIARTEGIFTFPDGPDGSSIFFLREKINITWNGVSDYPVFSLGVLQSTNQTLSWLISNSEDQPTTYEWTVNVDELGFDLNDSREFSFYACNGSDATGDAFSLPFGTNKFIVRDEEVSTTTSSATQTSTTSFSSTTQPPTSTQAQSTAAGTTTQTVPAVTDGVTSSISSPVGSVGGTSNASSELSTSAKVGIGIGVVLGVILIAGAVIWFVLRKKDRSTRVYGMSEIGPSERSCGNYQYPAQLHADSVQKPLAELDGAVTARYK